MRKLKLIAAVVVTMAVVIFLLMNMGNQARLRLFREFQINTLMLVGLSYFAGLASMVLFSLWRRQQADGASGETAGEATSDVDL